MGFEDSIRPPSDLLCSSSESDAKKLAITAGEFGVMNVTDLTLNEVKSVEDVERLMVMAEKHRTVKGTVTNPKP